MLKAKVVDRPGVPGVVSDGRLFVIGCGRDSLQPLEVAFAGKKTMNIAAFLNGYPVAEGEILEQTPGG